MEAKPLPSQDRFDELRRARCSRGSGKRRRPFSRSKVPAGAVVDPDYGAVSGLQQELAVAVNDGLGF